MNAEIKQHSVVTPRSARYYSLGDTSADCIWIVLHGYGQLAAEFVEDFRSAANERRLFVAPEALSRFYLRAGQGAIGANWMTSEDRENEIADYIRYLNVVTNEVKTDPSQRVFVLGFSQGSATACRWFAATELELSGLLIWAGGIPPDLDVPSMQRNLGSRQMRFVVGDEDQFMPKHRFRAEVDSLVEMGISVAPRTFPGRHVIKEDVLQEEIIALEANC